ncbi:unnamed protein product [Lathyrus oleraceus]
MEIKLGKEANRCGEFDRRIVVRSVCTEDVWNFVLIPACGPSPNSSSFRKLHHWASTWIWFDLCRATVVLLQ